MKQGIFEIKENVKLAKDVYKMILSGDTSDITKPGQFINIQLDGFYLRRPISVCDYDEKCVTIIYKVVGKGTEVMADMKKGEKLGSITYSIGEQTIGSVDIVASETVEKINYFQLLMRMTARFLMI